MNLTNKKEYMFKEFIMVGKTYIKELTSRVQSKIICALTSNPSNFVYDAYKVVTGEELQSKQYLETLPDEIQEKVNLEANKLFAEYNTTGVIPPIMKRISMPNVKNLMF